tara:strand:- start:28 stop:408 length:381 start_codon:yes stop_codon:yes gene_type:complete
VDVVAPVAAVAAARTATAAAAARVAAALAAAARVAAALAATATGATNAAAIATATVLHDRERLLRWLSHLHQERVRCRRHGAWLVRHECVGPHIEHKLILSARMLHLVLLLIRVQLIPLLIPLRLW